MLDIIFWIAIFLFIVSALSLLYKKITGKSTEDMKRDAEKMKETNKPRQRVIYETLYLVDTENEERFDKAYRNEYDENDEYDLTAKELKEDYMDEKVYRYAPYELPLKIEDGWAYSYIDEGEWLKVGRVKKTDLHYLEEGDTSLAICPMEYKKVTEDGITKDSRTPYFALTVKKVIHDQK